MEFGGGGLRHLKLMESNVIEALERKYDVMVIFEWWVEKRLACAKA